MKTPINTDPIVADVRPAKWIGGSGPDSQFQARGNGIKSSSITCAAGAVQGLALKWFFGGNTIRFAGPEERAALKIKKIGKNRYRASLIAFAFFAFFAVNFFSPCSSVIKL